MLMRKLSFVKKVYFFTKSAIAAVALSFLFSYCTEASYSFSWVYLLLGVCLVFLLKPSHEIVPLWKPFLWGLALFLLRAVLVWGLKVFPLEDYRLVILTLQMPLNGFVFPYVWEFFSDVFLVGFVFVFLAIPFFKTCILKLSVKGSVVLFFVMMSWNILSLYLQLPLQEYLNFFKKGSPDLVLHESLFWKEHYVDADSVEITGGGKNLVLIIMESMENWPSELTPEIERMSTENVSFSFADSFGGGRDIAGSTNTYCATVSKTTGLPLLRNSKHLGADLVRAKSIYDVLHHFGYKNVFLQGSDANFAGTKDFVMNHGIDYLYDMNNLKNRWDMDAFFRNFRSFATGITDKRLYEISKEILDTISTSPFSLTLTTIETHYPYGFYDKECLEKPESSSEEARFKATLQCASREVWDFVEWIKSQEFYKNTQIVIVGDHLFMGHYFVDGRERRWIDVFINSALIPKTKKRRFVSIDIAPTILEGMGFQIEGHKMGLGTSLFSDSLTLLEKMGWMRLNSELKNLSNSLEYNQLNWDEPKNKK